MAKNDNAIYWILGIAILLLVLTQTNLFKKQEMVGLTPHYYKDGVEVFPSKGLFSLVTPPGESFDQISFDVSVTNQDIPIENIQIVDASPSEFLNALDTTDIKTLNVGESTTWTSGLMDTVQFEAVSPVNFWINISGYDTFNREIVYGEAYSGDITFEPGLISSWSLVSSCARGYDDMATDGTYIYIICRSTGQDSAIEKYDMEGNFIERWNLYTYWVLYDGYSLLEGNQNPTGIAINGNKIFVGDFESELGIYEYDLSGNYQSNYGPPIGSPSYITNDGINNWHVDYSGNLYKYDLSWNLIGIVNTLSSGTNPSGMTTDGNYIWNNDDTSGDIYTHKHDMSGNFIEKKSLIEGRGITKYGNSIWISEIGPTMISPSTPIAKVYQYNLF